jgi:hypothetical protein
MAGRGLELGKPLFFVLEIVAIIFFVAWLLGISTTYTLGGMIHVFLAPAVILAQLRISKVQSRP